MQATRLEDSFPLAPIQEGMLFNSLYSPGSAVDVVVGVLDLHEDLDEPLFLRAWQLVIDHHPALRSCFRWQDREQPCQEVHRGVSQPSRTEDWSALPDSEKEPRWTELVARERATRFELSRPPLTRLVAVRLRRGHHRILWVYHHAVFDGVGMVHVFSQVFAAYRALQRGEAWQPGPSPTQRDYVEWLGRQDPAASEAFWRGHLAGLEGPTRLGIERDHGDGEVGGEVQERIETCPSQSRLLTEAGTAELHAWARARGLTPNILLQGAWAILASRYSGERRVVFGVVKSGRRSCIPDADRLVGVLMNTLPMAVDVDPEAEVVAWLGGLRHQWEARRAHEHSSLVRIKEWSGFAGRLPLFESLIVYDAQDLDSTLSALGGDWSRCHADVFGQPVAPVSLNAYDGRRLLLRINYHELRVDHDAIARMLGHLQTLLAALVSGAARRVGDLPLLTADERRQALALRGPAAGAPSGATVHGLIEAQCARTPQAVAASCGPERLTYAELAARADRLAARLRACGAGPDRMVGLCVERGLDLPVGMLGILEAGGAWVPLDPAFPTARLALALQDTAASVLVTQRRLLGALPDFRGEVVCLDDGPAAPPAQQRAAPPAAAGPESLAYVIHTSGSTGRPKGVLIEHRAVVNLLLSMAREPGLAPEDVLLAVTTLSFDIAVLELLLPLCVGARVEIAPREVAGDGTLLREALAATRATVMQATPATWQLLVDSDWAGDGRLKMLCGGEELPPALAAELLRRGGELWNMYGPTETTIWSATGRVRLEDVAAARAAGARAVEIGPPIANTLLCVLDARGRLVPRGVPGELCIGGLGLARGYLGQPELTAERFPEGPWPDELPGRLYRTGDRVRCDESGRLQFLGRVDRQVKLRGYRIELGEVEAVLRAGAGVGEAVALLREDVPGDRRLVAYVVPRAGAACDAEELRRFAATRLPDYMVPAACVTLERLPLSPNGKVDRRALPAPQARAAGPAHVPPAGPTQAAVAAECADLLHVERVGAQDDFFALGGHSLLATRLVSRLRGRFGVELRLRQVFDRPTVEGIAECVDAARSAERRQVPAPIAPVPRDRGLTLSFAQSRLWLLHQLGAGDAYNMHLVLELAGALDRGALARALAAILARHEVLRTRYVSSDGRPVPVVEREVALPLELLDRSGLAGRERGRAVREAVVSATEQPFDLERAPLLRARLLRLGAEDHVLVLVLHHLVADAWSLDVLVRELAAHYREVVEATPCDLPALPVQYADYAAWQRARLSGEELRLQVAHWRERLAGAPAVLDLPTDRPRPAVQTYAGSAHAFALGEGLTAALRATAREHGVTLSMLCLAAFHALLARHSGQRDLVLGLPIANRLRAEVEGLVGMFVNTLALRVDAADDPPFGELLARVQRACLDAYDNQELPFEKLVEELVPERDLSRTPLFQVLFSMNAARTTERAAAGVVLRVLPFEITRVRFDLELHLFAGAADVDGLLAFNTDLFDAPTAARLAGHLRLLLESVATDTRARVSALPMLPDAERAALLGAWGGTRVAYPQGLCLHGLFEAQVARTPDAPALVGGAEPLSYGELDRRANRLAQALVQRGVGPEVCVGLCLERGPALVVAVLGVLKAGGAYVPLDPDYPVARLAEMARSAALPLVLVQAATRDRLGGPSGAAPALLSLDEDAGRIAACPDEPPRSAVAPDNLAYVLFTSGSTGRPKGVAMPHAPLVNLMHWQFGDSRCGPGCRTLQFAPLAFDVSCQEIFATLGGGGTLCLIGEEARRDPVALLEYLRAQAVERVFMPFVALQQMVEVAVARDLLPGSLREVITAGEQLQVGTALVEFFRRLDGCRLVNQYGPTECHVVTSLTLEGPPETWPRLPPIGRPIANARAFVLDAHQAPCPVGVPGELYLGGAAVGRGYLGDDELTARRFVAAPPALGPESRLYRTGDLARVRHDGCLEFLGRADTQVKLRGFRVELGEVESALLDHPRVRQAALMVREDQPGDRRLVAYVVAEGLPAPAPGELRAFLKQRLPAYMLPAAFVPLASLPLTPSGKLDRRALPAPEERQAAAEWVAPRGPAEEALAAIWSGLLKVERVGAHDDFFELGGHSLLGMQVISRIRDAFGVSLPLQALFEAPTVAGLAAAVEARTGVAGGAAIAGPAADDEVLDL
jgi:amino acid adenylation domain-containing protein